MSACQRVMQQATAAPWCLSTYGTRVLTDVVLLLPFTTVLDSRDARRDFATVLPAARLRMRRELQAIATLMMPNEIQHLFPVHHCPEVCPAQACLGKMRLFCLNEIGIGERIRTSAARQSAWHAARVSFVPLPLRCSPAPHFFPGCGQNCPFAAAQANGVGGPGGAGGEGPPPGALTPQVWPSPCPASQDW